MVGVRVERRLATRLQVVLALVAVSVVLVAVAGYSRLVGYERRMLDVYQQRVVPLRELKEISDAYAIDVVDTVHKVASVRLAPAQGGSCDLEDANALVMVGRSLLGIDDEPVKALVANLRERIRVEVA